MSCQNDMHFHKSNSFNSSHMCELLSIFPFNFPHTHIVWFSISLTHKLTHSLTHSSVYFVQTQMLIMWRNFPEKKTFLFFIFHHFFPLPPLIFIFLLTEEIKHTSRYILTQFSIDKSVTMYFSVFFFLLNNARQNVYMMHKMMNRNIQLFSSLFLLFISFAFLRCFILFYFIFFPLSLSYIYWWCWWNDVCDLWFVTCDELNFTKLRSKMWKS